MKIQVEVDAAKTAQARQRWSQHPDLVVGRIVSTLPLYRVFDGEELSRVLRKGVFSGGFFSAGPERAFGASWGTNISEVLQWGEGQRGRRLGDDLFLAKADGFDAEFAHLDPDCSPPVDLSDPNQVVSVDSRRFNTGLGASLRIELSDVDLFKVGPDLQLERISVAQAKELTSGMGDVLLRKQQEGLLIGSILDVPVSVAETGGRWDVINLDTRKPLVKGARSEEEAREWAEKSIRQGLKYVLDPVLMDQAKRYQQRFEPDADPEKVRGGFGVKPRDTLIVETGSRKLGINARERLTVFDVWQRSGERPVYLKVGEGMSKAHILYVVHANELLKPDFWLLSGRDSRIGVRKK